TVNCITSSRLSIPTGPLLQASIGLLSARGPFARFGSELAARNSIGERLGRVDCRLSPTSSRTARPRRLQPFAGRAEPTGSAERSFADGPLIAPSDNLWWPVPIAV